MATRRGMLRLLEQHRRNLEALELQKAQAGALAPVAIDLQIEDEREAIRQLEADLDALDADSVHSLRTGNGGVNDAAEAQAIMDGQLTRIENKLDRIEERTYDTRQRMGAVERDVQEVAERLARLEAQVTALQQGPQIVTRSWLMAGATLMLAVFILLAVIAWRLV